MKKQLAALVVAASLSTAIAVPGFASSMNSTRNVNDSMNPNMNGTYSNQDGGTINTRSTGNYNYNGNNNSNGNYNTNGNYRTNNVRANTANGNGSNWGWLGLIGLAGLAGLRKPSTSNSNRS